MTKVGDNDQYDPEETARRRDAVLKIMVNTPPQPRVTRQAPKTRKSAAADRAGPKASGRPRKSDPAV
ncbi:MAG TPA: hypothetical protein VND87_10695 [Stellaceae bacterium]|nr:hypothetical protein [Stellaceae bacterium]